MLTVEQQLAQINEQLKAIARTQSTPTKIEATSTSTAAPQPATPTRPTIADRIKSELMLKGFCQARQHVKNFEDQQMLEAAIAAGKQAYTIQCGFAPPPECSARMTPHGPADKLQMALAERAILRKCPSADPMRIVSLNDDIRFWKERISAQQRGLA